MFGCITYIVMFLWFHMDKVTLFCNNQFTIYNEFQFSFNHIEVLFHNIVIVVWEILSGHKLHQSKVRAWTFHEIFWATIPKTVLPVIFVEMIHRVPPYIPGAFHMCVVSPSSAC